MQRYSPQVKLYAIEQRRSGESWREVQEAIRKRFGIPPPSIRGMEKWEKEISREQLRRMVSEEDRKGLSPEEVAGLQQMAETLIPALWQARNISEDLELQAWLVFLSIVELQLGADNFDRLLSQYQTRRLTPRA
jgi:hypothetical protein